MEEIITESTESASANESGMQEFMNSFNGNGNQTDDETVKDTPETEKAEENSSPADQSSPQTDENNQSETGEGKEEVPADGQEKPDNMFTIKVNKEEKQVSLEEMTALAQKGSDYDRIRTQRDQLQAELEDLKQTQASAQETYNPVIAQLEAISRTTNKPLEELASTLRRSIKRKEGLSDAEIEATIRAEDAEFAVQAMRTQAEQPQVDENGERMQRELQEFRAVYPDVELTEELCSELSADVKGGMTLANAYHKNQNAKKDAEIQRLNNEVKKLSAKVKGEEQNRKNYYSSPGSMSDDGGKTQLTGMDEFMSRFMR